MLTMPTIERFGDILFKSSLVVFVVFTPISIAITEGAFWLVLIGYAVNKLSGRKPLFCATGIETYYSLHCGISFYLIFFNKTPLQFIFDWLLSILLLYYMLANYELKGIFIRKLVVLIILMTVICPFTKLLSIFRFRQNPTD